MIRFSKLLPRVGLWGKNIVRNQMYFSSNVGDGSKGLDNPVPEVISKRQFIPNLYGIEVKKHIFPNFNKTVNVSA